VKGRTNIEEKPNLTNLGGIKQRDFQNFEVWHYQDVNFTSSRGLHLTISHLTFSYYVTCGRLVENVGSARNEVHSLKRNRFSSFSYSLER